MANLVKKIRNLSENDKSGIKRAFEFLDTDKDGHLDYDETKAAMKALGFEVKKTQLLAIMQAYNKQDENKISFYDFYYVMADKIAKRDPLDEIKHVYKLFTAESSCGKITLVDLQRINKTLGSRLTQDEMSAMIEEFDIDQDGCTNLVHFYTKWRGSMVGVFFTAIPVTSVFLEFFKDAWIFHDYEFETDNEPVNL